MDLKKVDEIIDSYNGEKSWLVMVLQEIQNAYNYLPAAALHRVAGRLGLGLGHVYSVATFYSSFSLTKRGRHLIRMCDGTACHLRSGPAIRDEIKRQLGIDAGETTEDKVFTLDVVACLGACALAPVMTIDSKYYGRMTPQRLKATLDSHRKMAKAEK